MPFPGDLSLYQIAREAVAGSDLAATSKLAVEKMNFKEAGAFYRPNLAKGLLLRNKGSETVAKRFTEWSAEGPVSFEQAMWLLGGAIVHVASPTGSDPYTWTYTRPIASIPTLSTYTFERRENDGSTQYDHAWHYGVIRKLTLSAADGEPLRFAAEGFARIRKGETLTSSLSMPTVEIPVHAQSKVYIDSTYGGLGGSLVSTQVLGWKVEIQSGAEPIWTADARSDLDFSTINISSENTHIEASILCLLGAQYATELAAAEAGTLRAVRIQADGSNSRSLKIDFLAKYKLPSLQEFGEQDGYRIVELVLEESTDGTNLLVATLVNHISAFA